MAARLSWLACILVDCVTPQVDGGDQVPEAADAPRDAGGESIGDVAPIQADTGNIAARADEPPDHDRR